MGIAAIVWLFPSQDTKYRVGWFGFATISNAWQGAKSTHTCTFYLSLYFPARLLIQTKVEHTGASQQNEPHWSRSANCIASVKPLGAKKFWPSR